MLLCLLKCWTWFEYRRYFRLNINCILEWRLNILVVWHFDTTLLYKCIKSGNTFNSLRINLNIVLSILNFTDSFNFLLRLFSSSCIWLTRPLVITDTLLPAQCRWLSLLVTAFLLQNSDVILNYILYIVIFWLTYSDNFGLTRWGYGTLMTLAS